MTTLAQIRSAWLANIWNHATIQAITTKIYNYDITLDSTFEYSKLRYNQEFNAFVYIVTKYERLGFGGTKYDEFEVEVRYYRKADVEGNNFNTVLETFETLFGLVRTQLSHTWGGTVGAYRTQESAPTLSQVTLEGVPVWLGTYKFFATN